MRGIDGLMVFRINGWAATALAAFARHLAAVYPGCRSTGQFAVELFGATPYYPH